MTIKEIIDHLDELEKFDVEDPDNREALRAAIENLRTHQDAQPNEALRWRSCKKEKPTEKGRYEVVCRNGHIPPYVLLGFWNPDNPGWDLYGVTHWRPLPEPPKEET